MKTYITLRFITSFRRLSLFILLTFLANCKEGRKQFSEFAKQKSELAQYEQYWHFPNGTAFGKMYDHEMEDSTLSFLLPANWKIIVSNGENEPLSYVYGGIRCRCKKGSGGCSPVNYGNEFGCINANCEVCEGSLTNIVNDNETVTIKELDTRDAVLINIADTVTPVFKFDNLIGRKMFSKVLTELPGFEQNILEAYYFIYGCKEKSCLPGFIFQENTPAPIEYKYIAILYFGTIAFIPVPDSADNTSPYLPDWASHSCRCHNGSGCTPKSKLGVRYCEAGACTDCELNTIISVPEGDFIRQYSLQITNGFVKGYERIN
jgi:hypothetical protein